MINTLHPAGSSVPFRTPPLADQPVPACLRRLVVARARGGCEYCRSQARFATQPFSVEHIAARSRGGPTKPDNLALACQGCNNHKYTRTEGQDPIGGASVPLYHPRRQHWLDHFAWDDTFTLIFGLTPQAARRRRPCA